MYGSRIHRSGDVDELEAERAARQIELTHVADKGNVGVVDGKVEISLVDEAGGLIGAGAGFLFLSRFGGRDAVAFRGEESTATESSGGDCDAHALAIHE